MDYDNTYLIMCWSAEELQAERFAYLQRGDYAARADGEGVRVEVVSLATPNIGYVWLPRQDQLLALMDRCAPGEVIQRFYDWFKSFEMASSAEEYCSATMDQLFLRFAMFALYGKEWVGDSWVKVTV